MKKKLALILVLVLCAALLFTFAACDKPDDVIVDNTPLITEAQAAEAIALIEEKAELWLLNNGVDTYTNRSTELKNAISAFGKVGNINSTSFSVTPGASNTYNITVKWGSREATCTVNDQLNEWGDRAGKEYLVENEGEDIEDIIIDVYKAFLNTIEDAKDKGEAFPEDSIGFNAKAYLLAGYGVGHENIDLALQVKGNIGDTDAATDLAIELLANDEIAYGLYFDGAAAKEDCKIYLRSGDNYIHIDYANVVGIITDLIDYEPVAALEEEGEIEDLEDLFGSTVSGIMDMAFALIFPKGSGCVIAEEGDVTTYQLKLDLNVLISGVTNLLGSLGEDFLTNINTVISDVLPPPLNQLDLATVSGIAGQLMFTVVVEDDLVTDAEISLNVPKRDFRFSATDTVSKVYGPLNFAFGLEGVNLAEQTAIIPTGTDIAASDYFSPLNINFTGDVTVKAEDKEGEGEVLVDSVFSFDIKTDINPFNLDVAKGYIKITELKNGESTPANFVTLAYDQSTGDGYLSFKNEFAYYVDAYDVYDYIMDNYDVDPEVFVKNVIEKFLDIDLAKADEPAAEKKFDFNALIGAVGDIQEWYDALVEDEKFVVSIDKEDLLNSDIAISVVTADINAILTIIDGIGILPIELPTLTDPDSVEVYFNGEGATYQDKFFVRVIVDDVPYIFEIDGTKWEADKEVNVSFSIRGIDMARLNIVYVEDADPEVYIVGAEKAYTVTLTLELINNEKAEGLTAATATYDTYEFEGLVTENEAGVLNGFQGTFTDKDSSFYTVYGEGVGIWTYEELEGIKDFDFTFQNVPHYGFGYDSDDFQLDVDLDNFELNWGARNADIDVVPEDAASYVDKTGAVCDEVDDIMEDLDIQKKIVY